MVGETPAVPASTVVLLRDRDDGDLETLMLRKRTEIAFGGMWVFPGGRIDAEDHADVETLLDAARVAASREAAEEAGLRVTPGDLVHFAYWLPPPIAPRRFATWFFAARASADDKVVIDDGEITNHEWMRPTDAIRRCGDGELELAPPTWVTLNTVNRFADVATALRELGSRAARDYETRVAHGEQGPVAMWKGDAGYETSDPSALGSRHRIETTPDGSVFDESGYRDHG